MKYLSMLRIPVHYLTTKRKLSILDRLTARLTYAVRLFCAKIEMSGQIPQTRRVVRHHSSYVREKTGLSSGFIQQAEDKALWMWLSYEELHREWKRKLDKAKTGSKWHRKLLKREPSTPCNSKRSNLKKIPTRFDVRTGEVQRTSITLAPWVVHISTLKKGETIDVLLNPSEWHKEMLEQAEKIRGFEIVKKNRKYYAHVLCEYRVPSHPPMGVAGVDLGLKRPLSAVLIDTGFQFSILHSGKKEHLKPLNDRISHLRRLERWETLKKLRHKRRYVAEHHDRMIAKEFADISKGYQAFIGHPKYIRYRMFKGNEKRRMRKMLQGWSFLRQATYIIHEKAKLGDVAETVNEWWTSSKCWICGARVKRPKQSRIICENGHQYDADFNGCMNILRRGIARLRIKTPASLLALNGAGATVDMALNGR